jgi:hypothetical protein
MALKTIYILRAGPLTSRSPNATTPFVIEVETADGIGYLQISPQASAVLTEELATYLKRYAHTAKNICSRRVFRLLTRGDMSFRSRPRWAGCAIFPED